ncbi:MAG: hypothetical protein LBS80_06565, partial [Tannerella sp.]|nr:hypothetical protein [Tannerella sp.]
IIYLEEKDNNLGEVVVHGKPTFTEKQKMRAFKEQFLGMSTAGFSCKILNEGVIRLVYDPEENKLHGYASAPIEIENKYLGYFISWELIEFTLTLNSNIKSLNNNNIGIVSIVGAALFKETKTDVVTAERREFAFNVSKRNFFKLIADRAIEGSNFKILIPDKKITELPASNWFKITQKSSDRQETTIAMNPNRKDSLGIIYMWVQQRSNHMPTPTSSPRNTNAPKYSSSTSTFSELFFMIDTFKVDNYGNTNIIKELATTGEMGSQRIGDMLPFNYLPHTTDNW